MSKFSSFMKATGEVVSALAEAQMASRKAPIDNITTTVNKIDWENPQATSVLYSLTADDLNKLREADYILNRFPRK